MCLTSNGEEVISGHVCLCDGWLFHPASSSVASRRRTLLGYLSSHSQVVRGLLPGIKGALDRGFTASEYHAATEESCVCVCVLHKTESRYFAVLLLCTTQSVNAGSSGLRSLGTTHTPLCYVVLAEESLFCT